MITVPAEVVVTAVALTWRCNGTLTAFTPSLLCIGAEAKAFFASSKLSKEQLSQIWALSDRDTDNRLSVPEFCIAMHLIMACRKRMPLPAMLPPDMLPGDQQVSMGMSATNTITATTSVARHYYYNHQHYYYGYC